MDIIHSRPLSEAGRKNFGHIFRKSDPVHSLTPGTIREYRSNCCWVRVEVASDGTHYVCTECRKPCAATLIKVNP